MGRIINAFARTQTKKAVIGENPRASAAGIPPLSSEIGEMLSNIGNKKFILC